MPRLSSGSWLGALKKAASTPVTHNLPRIFGKSANSDSSPTEMPGDKELDLTTGTLPANMESGNAKETPLRPVPSSKTRTLFTARSFLS